MNYYLKERDALEQKNAGSKARNDVEQIVEALGYRAIDVVLPYKKNKGLVSSLVANVQIFLFFRKKLSHLCSGDQLLVQFPPRSHSIFFPVLFRKLQKRGTEVTFLIHDLERMRYSKLNDVPFKKRVRILLEETRLLETADRIICHNDKMKAFLEEQGVSSETLVPLGIFDYLCSGPIPNIPHNDAKNRIIIAGNLSPEKCVYLTELQKVPGAEFQLYGVGYEDLGQPNVTYHGSFMPDELVGALVGDFGLVWDGESIDTCTGIFGNYLRLNDPHKLSLYLTAGLPVIVWDEAAVADFVKENHVGFAVSSLKEIPDRLSNITTDEYDEMAQNARSVARSLRDGQFLKRALSRNSD